MLAGAHRLGIRRSYTAEDTWFLLRLLDGRQLEEPVLLEIASLLVAPIIYLIFTHPACNYYMASIRQLQYTLLITLVIVSILAIFVAGNYGILMFILIIAINAGLSMFMNDYQWDAIVAGLCLYSGLMLVDPVGLALLGSNALIS